MKTVCRVLTTATLLLTTVAIVFADAQAPVDTTIHEPPIVLACIGDSITARGNPNGYPSQLGRMLGDKWRVDNYGISGTTLMNVGGNAYQKKELLPVALASKPDVVVIMLGTNDSKPYAWKKKEQFIPDYKTLIGKFKALENKPRIFIAKPPYVNDGGKTTGINEAAILEELPMIDQIAKEESVGLIDVHGATVGKNELFRDGVHPTGVGSGFIAKVFYQALTGKEFEGEIPPASKPKAEDKPAG
jgi:acyl-CoA thioesterase-1